VDTRGSGILLHITSLPSSYGIGDLGPGAYKFADFLSATGQKFWQILPLTKTSIAYGNSPYSSFSAFAGNSLLISPDLLIKDGILSKSDIGSKPGFSVRSVNYDDVSAFKNRMLGKAFQKNRDSMRGDREYNLFCNKNSFWLDDYALFFSLKRRFEKMDWGCWPENLRDRRGGDLRRWRKKLSEEIEMEKFVQYIFFRQWEKLKQYLDNKHLRVIGDMPIYVNYDSSDVWASPDIFRLDKKKTPAYVAGVPPDYFSSTGQLWGHPVYNWGALRDSGYSWWLKRIEHNLRLFHMFRLDHFRGFVAFWEVRASETSAINGRWKKAPAKDFFKTLFEQFPRLPIIAEDLGYITPDVREVMELFGFPGMKVLMFAFSKNLVMHAPHNYVRNCVVYTGTHDNNTIKAWFENELEPANRKKLSEYIGHMVSNRNVHWQMIRLAMRSVADTVIIPMQDILGLHEYARMNRPASSRGNWEWRLRPEQLSPSLVKRLSRITAIFDR
jgi:4-alpha-glucanotransferase